MNRHRYLLITALWLMAMGYVHADEQKVITFDAKEDKAPYGVKELTKGDVTISVTEGKLGYHNETTVNDYYLITITHRIIISVPNGVLTKITFTSDAKNKASTNGLGYMTYEKENGEDFSFPNNNPNSYTRTWTGPVSESASFFTNCTTHITKIEVTYTKTVETVNRTISSVGYATLYYSDKNLIVPEGIVARTYYVENGTILYESRAYHAGDVIPHGTGVLLKGNAGEYAFEVTEDAGTADENSALRGSDSDALTTGGTYYYKLAVDPDSEAVGFYWGSEGGGAFTNKANRAYLAIDGAWAANSSFIFDEAVTGVTTLPTKSTALKSESEVYTIHGQRMADQHHFQRGLYIKNGQKFIVR